MNISLCHEDGRYEAGGMLMAKWRISRVPIDQLQGLEASVLWHTEGKGDEDLHVHHFQRLTEQQLRSAGLADEQSITCRLPVTPLSYHGKLITIRWSLRLRLFLVGSREILTEHPFYVVARTTGFNRSISTIARDEKVDTDSPRVLASVVDWSATAANPSPVIRKPGSVDVPRSSAHYTAS